MQDPDASDRFALADMREDTPSAVESAPRTPDLSATPVSLMITNRQRAALRALGFSDEAVAAMRPAEAHAHLGI